MTISPGDGDLKAQPEKGVVVTAEGGTLDSVTVTVKGKQVEGRMAADKGAWKSRTLWPGHKYQVTAVATNPEGKSATVNAAFATHKAPQRLRISDITPTKNETVGIGMPIQVVFNRAVEDKKAVERALEVKSEKPATGAWYWKNDTTAIFRTKNDEYWEPNQKVAFRARLGGVKAGERTWGAADADRSFTIGDAHMVHISTKTKQAVAKENGKTVRTWPISAGKGGRVVNGVDTLLTAGGVHLVMGKENPAIMTSEWKGVDPEDKENGGYREVVPHAVRISASGEYIHSMASTIWAQGEQNVSNGCINSAPKDARWYYKWSYRGDPVNVTGSKRKLDWDNGWSYYEMPWDRWVKGSALKRAVTTG